MLTENVIKLTAEKGKILMNDKGQFFSVVVVSSADVSKYQEITLEQKARLEAKMTVREFMLALLQRGITKEQIEELKAQNDQVWAELQANYVYRSNPLLDQLCGQFGLTPQDVDDIFGV